MIGDIRLHDPYNVATPQQLAAERVHAVADQFAPLTGELLEITEALEAERAQGAGTISVKSTVQPPKGCEHDVSKVDGNIEALLCSLLVLPGATLAAKNVTTALKARANLTQADWVSARKRLLGANILTLVKDSESKRFVKASVDVDAVLEESQDGFITEEARRLARIAQSGGAFDEADIEKYSRSPKPSVEQDDTFSLRSARVPQSGKRVVFEFPVNDRHYAYTSRRGSYGHIVGLQLRYIHAIGFARQQKFRSEKERSACITRLIGKGLVEQPEQSLIDKWVARMQEAGYLQPDSREEFGPNIEHLLWPEEAKA